MTISTKITERETSIEAWASLNEECLVPSSSRDNSEMPRHTPGLCNQADLLKFESSPNLTLKSPYQQGEASELLDVEELVR